MKFDFMTNAVCFFAVTAGMALAASSHSAHAQQCCQTASTCTGSPMTSQAIQEPERVDGHVSDSTLASALTAAATFYKDSASRSEGITLATGGCDSAFSDRTCAVEQEALSHFTITDVKITRYDGTEGMQCSSDSDCSCAIPAAGLAHVDSSAEAARSADALISAQSLIENGPESAPVAALNGGAALSRSAGASAAEHFRAAAAGGAAGAAPASAGSGLQGVRLVAAPRYEDKALTAAALSSVDHLRGAPLDAGTLQQALESFTDFYRNKGYTLSQAYLPAQSIVDGWVDLAVVNPKYNNFNLENVSYVSDDYMKYLMTDVYELEGKDIVEGELDERLLKLSDIGTFNIAGQIDNSDAAGLYRDVDFQAAPDGDQVNFAVFADNYGNKSAGRYRFGGLMEVISPAGMADRLSVVYARSNEKQNNYSINYRIPVNSH
ncbi:POTRA domain-containing protein, partial [Anaerobiospirillum sp. NML120449]|uniref:POTRA domain-containing protein n=1 Tax=Anaerobiospirillum sp. NML120449 TaxID=2932817 RepID=UPI001FF51C1A